MNISEFLKYGAVGLSAALAVLICFLIKGQQKLQFGIKHINKEVHNNVNKFLYVFLFSSILMSVFGYSSEIIHDLLVSKTNDKHFAEMQEKFEKISTKYENIKEELIDMKLKNVEYKTKLDLILKETQKNERVALAVPPGPLPAPPDPSNPVPVKKEAYVKAPFEEPKVQEQYVKSDQCMKDNIKRIVEGLKPMDFADWYAEKNKPNVEWFNYRTKMEAWLQKNPGQREYYEYNYKLKKSVKSPSKDEEPK